jgi:hypothetical protein
MSKLSKEMILPLASMFTGPYTEGIKQSMESLDWSETTYNAPPTRSSTLTKKQIKVRNKNKAAKKARKKNRK